MNSREERKESTYLRADYFIRSGISVRLRSSSVEGSLTMIE